MAKEGYFPLAWVLIAGGERERERSRTLATAGRWLAGTAGSWRTPEPLFLVYGVWVSVDNLKLAQPKWPNGCTVATLTHYQGLNEFQIELSCKMDKAYFSTPKISRFCMQDRR
jgi:hypothetical protein